ncbi:MAG: PIG-L family deacetylase [Chthonomonadales bacterium]
MADHKTEFGMPANKRVLALMPHPDDCEILCAGTLIRLREIGFEIHVATMTAGDKGSATLSRTEIADVRRNEARLGAEKIGASSYSCLDFQDLEIVFDNPSRKHVSGMLRQIDPGIVFTTPPVDYMADHEITSQLVRDACFNAAAANYETDGDRGPTSGVPWLYYTDCIGGHDLFGRPARLSCMVDISAHIEAKSEALACHASQREWLRTQHGMDDYLKTMRDWSASRGKEIGVEYAEGFCQHVGHPFPHEDLLANLLGATRLRGE